MVMVVVASSVGVGVSSFLQDEMNSIPMARARIEVLFIVFIGVRLNK